MDLGPYYEEEFYFHEKWEKVPAPEVTEDVRLLEGIDKDKVKYRKSRKSKAYSKKKQCLSGIPKNIIRSLEEPNTTNIIRYDWRDMVFVDITKDLSVSSVKVKKQIHLSSRFPLQREQPSFRSYLSEGIFVEKDVYPLYTYREHYDTFWYGRHMNRKACFSFYGTVGSDERTVPLFDLHYDLSADEYERLKDEEYPWISPYKKMIEEIIEGDPIKVVRDYAIKATHSIWYGERRPKKEYERKYNRYKGLVKRSRILGKKYKTNTTRARFRNQLNKAWQKYDPREDEFQEVIDFYDYKKDATDWVY